VSDRGKRFSLFTAIIATVKRFLVKPSEDSFFNQNNADDFSRPKVKNIHYFFVKLYEVSSLEMWQPQFPE